MAKPAIKGLSNAQRRGRPVAVSTTRKKTVIGKKPRLKKPTGC